MALPSYTSHPFPALVAGVFPAISDHALDMDLHGLHGRLITLFGQLLPYSRLHIPVARVLATSVGGNVASNNISIVMTKGWSARPCSAAGVFPLRHERPRKVKPPII